MHKTLVRTLVLASLLSLHAACSTTDSNLGHGSIVPQCGNGVLEGTEVCDDGSANGSAGKCKSDCSGVTSQTASVDGDVFAFLTEVRGPRLTGIKVSLLEHPEISVMAGDDAHFHFGNLTVGEDVTFVVEQPTINTTQTATYTLAADGFEPLSIQVIPSGLFAGLSLLLPQPPEMDKYCAIAATITRMGGSLYADQRQGMPDVSVSIDPPLPAENGPIYFNTSAKPDVTQVNTSIDGGVLFYRVPPGSYTIHATKTGMTFNSVRVNCRQGLFVNAGPPDGILANVPNPDYAGGVGRTDDEYSNSTDALCDQTATCVNATNTPTSYPATTHTSCKAMFRNMWAYVDESCDAIAKVRDAAKAFFDCRASSCDKVLGDDTVCADTDAAFRSAEIAYGACLTKSN